MSLEQYKHRWLISIAPALLLIGALSVSGADAPPKPTSEKEIRKQFFRTYTGSNDPKVRAKAIEMLIGVQEKKSLRILSGLLGASFAEVRIKACEIMTATPDPHGRFVKPLTGALNDKSIVIRIGAARALGEASIKADAIKGLVHALEGANRRLASDSKFITVIKESLKKLADKDIGKNSKGEKNSAWFEWWRVNRERLEREDLQQKNKLKSKKESTGK